MTRETAIAKSQQENLAKFVKERDLIKDTPQIADYKEEVAYEIKMILANIQLAEDAQAKINKRLNKLDKEKALLAKIAFKLQENGIFWAEDEFSIKKPSALSDFDAMLKTLPIDLQKDYIISETMTIIKTKIDSKKLKEKVPTIYKKTYPSIVKRTKKRNESGEFDDE
jgi:hypothetical protein